MTERLRKKPILTTKETMILATNQKNKMLTQSGKKKTGSDEIRCLLRSRLNLPRKKKKE